MNTDKQINVSILSRILTIVYGKTQNQKMNWQSFSRRVYRKEKFEITDGNYFGRISAEPDSLFAINFMPCFHKSIHIHFGSDAMKGIILLHMLEDIF